MLTLPLTVGSLPGSTLPDRLLCPDFVSFSAPPSISTRDLPPSLPPSSSPTKTSSSRCTRAVALQPVRFDSLRFSLLAFPLLMRLVLKVCLSDMPSRSREPTHLVFLQPYLLELRSCLPPGSNVCFLPSHPVEARVRRLERARTRRPPGSVEPPNLPLRRSQNSVDDRANDRDAEAAADD